MQGGLLLSPGLACGAPRDQPIGHRCCHTEPRGRHVTYIAFLKSPPVEGQDVAIGILYSPGGYGVPYLSEDPLLELQMHNQFSRRTFLEGSASLAITSFTSRVSVARAAPATAVDPGLIAAAQKERTVVWYASVDLPVAEKVARGFETKYSAISVRVERNGSERLFQRIQQEFASRIHAADVVNTSDGAHFVLWKRAGLLEQYIPIEAAQFLPKDQLDPDGTFMSWRASLSVIAYNTNLVRVNEAPRSFVDLLDPKWTGKIVKGHPGYSGTVMTATFQILKGSPNSTCCRCNPPPIHLRNSCWASARSWRMATNTTSFK
jgi:hypothetical protein